MLQRDRLKKMTNSTAKKPNQKHLYKPKQRVNESFLSDIRILLVHIEPHAQQKTAPADKESTWRQCA